MDIVYQTKTINTPAILTATPAATENLDRRYWSITNVGTNILFVRLGTGASSTVFHYILKGGTGDSDALGGTIECSNVVYTGLISVAGTTPKFVVTEM